MSNKHTISELDAGQLDMMWNFLMLGNIEPDVSDIKHLIEYTDKVRQALIQKTAGQRKDDSKEYVQWDEIGTYINFIVIKCLTLRISGMLDKIVEMMTDGKDM